MRKSTGIKCRRCNEIRPRSEYRFITRIIDGGRRTRIDPVSQICMPCEKEIEIENSWFIKYPLEWWGHNPQFNLNEINDMLKHGCFDRDTILEHQHIKYRVVGPPGDKQHKRKISQKEADKIMQRSVHV